MDDIIEAAAKAIDPTVWEMDAPVPTRQDVEIFHTRRQLSISRARAAIAAIMPAIGERMAACVEREGGMFPYETSKRLRALANTMAAEVGKG